jgi:hypothetical protein
MRLRVLALLVLSASACAPCLRGQASRMSNGVIVTEFSNPALSPDHWTLTLQPDGDGHFRSERGDPPPTGAPEMDASNVDREFRVSTQFARHVFQVAAEKRWFNVECESHMKVAFQGWKKLTYTGPEGHGSCTFNYSKDKEIQALGDSLTGVAQTLLEGARLEMLLQHDPLGLDKEMEYLTEAVKDGRLKQIEAIQGILEKLDGDQEVLERVRKRARALLAQAGDKSAADTNL